MSLEQAKTYQKIRNWIRLAGIGLTLAILLGAIAFGWSRSFYEWADFVPNRYGVLLFYFLFFSVYSAAISLPLELYSGFILEHRFHLSNQTIRAWFWEWTKKAVLSFAITALLVILLYGLIWNVPSAWWFWSWAGYAVFSLILGKLFPVLIVPLFYRYSPIQDQVLREKIVALAARFGFAIENVSSLNLSKTTKKANAAFTGFGKTKRVILGDTLLDSFTHSEIENVLAHELGHYRRHDIWKQFGFGAAVSFIGFWIVFHAFRIEAVRLGFVGDGDIRAFPLLCLILFLFNLVTGPLSNAFSRRAEHAADQFALEALRDSGAFISAMEKLSATNLADPNPHPVIEFLFYDHPAISKRIQFAKAYKPVPGTVGTANQTSSPFPPIRLADPPFCWAEMGEDRGGGENDRLAPHPYLPPPVARLAEGSPQGGKEFTRSHYPIYWILLFISLAVPVCLTAGQTDYSVLVEKGKSLIEQGSYESGIAVLETVLERDPKNSEAFNWLIQAYDGYHKQLTDEGLLEQAAVYLQKENALLDRIDQFSPREISSENRRLESRIRREIATVKAYSAASEATSAEAEAVVGLNAGREKYNEAVQYFNKREYETAESLLKESIQLDPSNSYTYELLGEIANLNQRLDEAEEYFKKAYSFDARPSLRQKYEKLLREKQIDRSQQHYEDEHFIIRYRRAENIEGSVIRDYLREAYRAISQEFGHYPQYKIPVILYDREEYQKLTEAVPHWSGAMFDGKIRLPVYEQLEDTLNLRRLIHHELTHAFALDLSKGRCPVWFHEGLAQYEENKIRPLKIGLLLYQLQSNALLSKDELTLTDVSQYQDKQKAALFYLQAFSLVQYVVEHFRLFRVKEMLIALSQGGAFEEKFEETFSVSFQEVWNDWLQNLKAQHGGG